MQRVHSVIDDTEVADAVREWIRLMFDSKKMNFNEFSIDLHLRKLRELSTDRNKQLFLVNLAIMGEWKTFYPEDKKKNPDKSEGTAPLADLPRYKSWNP